VTFAGWSLNPNARSFDPDRPAATGLPTADLPKSPARLERPRGKHVTNKKPGRRERLASGANE